MKGEGLISATIADAKRFLFTFRTIIERAPLQIYSSALIFSPRESLIRQNFEALVPSWIAKKPQVENTWTASLHTLEGHSSSVGSVVFSPDGKLLASASSDSTARIWEAATGAPLHTLEGHSGEVLSVVFSPDGKLLASASDDSTARIWSVETGDQLDCVYDVNTSQSSLYRLADQAFRLNGCESKHEDIVTYHENQAQYGCFSVDATYQ